MGLQSLSSFVLTNIELIETPELQDFIRDNIARYNDVIYNQIFLQEQGVSFSYTDTIPYYERMDLLDVYQEFVEMKNKRNQEILDNRNRK